jgi:predicted nucleic acid-binding protein
MAFLLDTNVVSELRKRERCNPSVRQWFSAVEADDLYISVLVVGEIRRGIELLRRRDKRGATALDRWLSELERRYGDRILPVTLDICRIWGGMSLQRPLAPIDGLMAATAVHHRMTLVTRNVEDVERSGVDVLDPFAAA